ncbi:MAG: adenylate/guanylate cyclase domain-containing protein [Clostridiales bacterium]|jgi:adenylate cyclase|nr:adenylate/guanylate cyclase domain-containing protein [Clostridiales bacterium]
MKKYELLGSLVIVAVFIGLFALGELTFWERRAQDSVFQKPGAVDPDIKIIGIDEKSLEKLGNFSKWTRGLMADAINILDSDPENRPAVIAVDVLYLEPSPDKEGDEALVRAVENAGNVVLGSYGEYGYDVGMRKIMRDYKKPYPGLDSAEHGLVNSVIDDDGVIRQALLGDYFGGARLPSFPYKAAEEYGGVTLAAEAYAEENSETYIPYYGKPGDYDSGYSFSDVFEEDFDPSFFADSIVLIGPYATGLMDSYQSSIELKEQMYGVEIHANTIQTILEGNFKRYAPNYADAFIMAGFGFAFIFLSKRVDIRAATPITAALLVGYVFAAKAFFNRGVILSIMYPIALTSVLYVYHIVCGYVLKTMETNRVKGAFRKYVDPKLVDKLVDEGEANSDEVGKKRHIAVLFVDVRGFTTMTEKLRDEPETVVKILNEYLELTSTSVFNNGGSVDKFVGDATMALFNGFVPLDDYVYRSVLAAWDIVTGGAAVNKSINEKYGVDLGFGVGVNCGEAIVGNLGPSFRKDYTAIGDTVNTAARLESNAKRGNVLISREVYEEIKGRGVSAESIGEIPLKGKNVKIEIFSVTGVIKEALK